MIPAVILGQLQRQLQNDAGLTEVKQVLIRDRESIDVFPTITIQPIQNVETDRIFNQQECTLSVEVNAYIKAEEKDRMVIGSNYRIDDTTGERVTDAAAYRITDDSIVGMFEMENAIKVAISADQQLNCTAIWCAIKRTAYSDPGDFPISKITIELEILYRQPATTRI